MVLVPLSLDRELVAALAMQVALRVHRASRPRESRVWVDPECLVYLVDG